MPRLQRTGSFCSVFAVLLVVSVGTAQGQLTFKSGTFTTTHDLGDGTSAVPVVDSTFSNSAFTFPTYDSTVGVGTDGVTIGAGGGDHLTYPTYANAAIAYGSGVTQTENGAPIDFTVPSKITIDFDLNWDVTDTLTGPIVAYQFLTVDLITTASGDSASVTGNFDYTLTRVNGGTMDTVSLDYFSEVKDGVTSLGTTLFDFDILRFAGVPATAGDPYELNITGKLEFEAVDPIGDAGIDVVNLEGLTGQQFENPFFMFVDDPGVIPQDMRMFLQGGGIVPEGNLVIPEPASAALLGLGLLGLAATRRRRRVA